MSTPFKHALIDYPGNQWEFAKEADTSEVRVSKLATGRAKPRPEEISKFAEILKRNPEELFQSTLDPVTA